MDPKPKTTPKDFFLYFGITASLYFATISLATLLFEIIDYAFPDKLQSYVDPYASSMRWTISALIIIVPIYLWLSRVAQKDIKTLPEKLEIAVRKWLTMLTLFLTGLALAIDLISLVYYFLGGEITTRFALKVLAVFVIAGGIFTYYWNDFRQTGEKFRRAWVWIVSFAVLASIIAGFVFVGSPFTQRKMKMDQQRVSDLQNIQYRITNYWQQKGILPSQMTDLNDSISGFSVPTDPDTDASYEYKKTGTTSFSLCAEFSLKTDSRLSKNYYEMPGQDTWTHDAGRVCFDRNIDPGLYPVRKTPGIQ